MFVFLGRFADILQIRSHYNQFAEYNFGKLNFALKLPSTASY